MKEEQNKTINNFIKVTSASSIEEILLRRIPEQINEDEEDKSYLRFSSEDAHLLHCRGTSVDPFKSEDEQTHKCGRLGFSKDALVEIRFESNEEEEGDSTHDVMVAGDWKKLKSPPETKKAEFSAFPRLTLLDWTCCTVNEVNSIYERMRSSLRCACGNSHITSPWRVAYGNTEFDYGGCCPYDCTYGIFLVDDRRKVEDEVDVPERPKSLVESLSEFRVGDAAPSFYFHSAWLGLGYDKGTVFDQLKLDLSEKSNNGMSLDENFEKNLILLVYKHLPPRLQLEPSVTDDTTTQLADRYPGARWEAFQPPSPEGEELAPLDYRQVSTPYQNIKDLLPSKLLSDDTRCIISEEARTIPAWTAWPETTHYSSPGGDDDKGPTWTVFPLVHTFPATDLSKRRFIERTGAHTPRTVRILRECLGDRLRTALFSRLAANSVLQAHTGWADLANHVFRVHVPLICGKNCGLWVDGCVETLSSPGVPAAIVFDDSKVHRAFNYGSTDRIVLILDIVRDDKCVPPGTATGGHSEELDAFIEQMG